MSDEFKVLEWDSSFFGIRIARMISTRPDRAMVQRAIQFSTQERIVCMYGLVDAGAPESIRTAEDGGFRVVDVRLTLTRNTTSDPLELTAAGVAIRRVEERDISALKAIASVSHFDSRYYADPGFSRSHCSRLYATWIENSCAGYEDCVLVAEREGKVCGYISCDISSHNTGQIGLLAVAADAQGRGIGGNLIRSAIRWFGEQECLKIDVVTQGCNSRAQQVYQKAGFVTDRVQLWLHRWFE